MYQMQLCNLLFITASTDTVIILTSQKSAHTHTHTHTQTHTHKHTIEHLSVLQIQHSSCGNISFLHNPITKNYPIATITNPTLSPTIHHPSSCLCRFRPERVAMMTFQSVPALWHRISIVGLDTKMARTEYKKQTSFSRQLVIWSKNNYSALSLSSSRLNKEQQQQQQQHE